MRNNELEKWSAGSVSDDARAIDAALARIGKPEVSGTTELVGRLIFALDLTSSREASLRKARGAISAMFETIKVIGAVVALRMAYFRGNECRVTDWTHNPDVLNRAMEKLSTKAGYTQIAKVLRLALAEKERLQGIVLVGDACEEDAEELSELAAALGKRKVPLFVFHDHDGRDLEAVKAAGPVFRYMAEASHGAYCPFGAGSAEALRELLSAIAAFSAAGTEGVKRMGPPVTPEAQQLQGRLLLLGPAEDATR